MESVMPHPRLLAALAGSFLLTTISAPPAAHGQAAGASLFSPGVESHPAVARALSVLERDFDRLLREWIHITQIPAPSGFEQERARYFREQLEREGLEVSIDSIGNVIARRPGSGGGPTIVYAAHMDTVHPLEVDVTVRIDGDTLRAPGVSDNSDEVASILALVRAMNEANVRTRGDLVFIGTVQEEVGLVGMRYWLENNPEPDMVVALDSGLGSVFYGAMGIYWTRFVFSGDGAHTLSSAGRPHPARALSRAILSIYDIEIPEGQGGAIFNVGILDGGEIYNAIPRQVSFTLDLRSVNPVLLDMLDRQIDEIVRREAEREGVRLTREETSRTPAGGTEDALAERRRHPLIETALEVHRHLGMDPQAVAAGATDANAAVARGIPAIAIGTGRGGGAHTLDEWAHVPSIRTGMRMLMLLTASLAGVE
jgi:tripeptide aminopeptidase